MNHQIQRQRYILAPALTVMVILLIVLAVYLTVSAQQAKYAKVIASQTPRIERLLGLREYAPQIITLHSQARQLIDAQAYPEDLDINRLNNDLSNQLRQMVQQSGLTLGAMRPLPPRKEADLEVLLFNFTLQGEQSQLQKLLSSIDTASPRLWVDSITIQGIVNQPEAPQIMNVDIVFSALRRTPS